MKTKKFITLREFAEMKKKDVSYINKLTKELKIKLIDCKRKSDGKIVKAAPQSSWDKLMSKVPTLNSKGITKGDVTLKQAAQILKMDKSNLMKFCKNNNIPLVFRSTGKTRAINCLSKSDFIKVQKIRNSLPKV